MSADASVLVINLGGMGDVLLSSPALRALRMHLSEGLLWMLVSRRASEMARYLGLADGVSVLDVGYGGVTSPLGAVSALGELLSLRRRRFDLAVNMRTLASGAGAWKMRLLLGFIDASATAGRNTEGRGCFFDVSVPEPASGGVLHESRYDAALVEACGVAVADTSIVLPPPGEEAWRRLVSLLPESSRPLVGVHPGGMPSRRWRLERFAGVTRRLHEKTGCSVVITGGKGERDLARHLETMLEGIPVRSLAGVLDLPMLVALMERLALFITNDTGPMHVAAAAGTPLVTVYGPGDLVRFDPRVVSPSARVVRGLAPCAPCERVYCESMLCLDTVSVDAVCAAALDLLTAREGDQW